MTFEENIKPYLENISGSSGHSAGPKVRHEDFFEPEPADPAIRSRVGADAAGFFRQHLT